MIQERQQREKKKMDYWGRGRVWARLGCAGAWEAGTAAPAPNLFCREKMWVSRACRAGEERAVPRRQEKNLGTPSEGEEAQKRGAADNAVRTRRLCSLPRAAALAQTSVAGCCSPAAPAPLLSPAKVAASKLAPVLSPGGSPEAKGHT